ncbi:MAG: hypothetical protein ACI9G1_003065 [Pirellulaceae bacterium]|jgi:hypothetical protein
MNRRRLLFMAVAVALSCSLSWAYLKVQGAGTSMSQAASGYLSTLDEKELAVSLKKYDDPLRVDWHFIPKDERKGLQIKNMSKEQRRAAMKLLKTSLSSVGYDKATQIMRLESVLNALEGGKGANIRDARRYYVTIFGKPTENGRWGLSFEGHHLSLNFVVENNEVISTSPSFFATNPATIMVKVPDTKQAKGTRVLAAEELLAFELVNALSKEQKSVAVLADTAPREIRAAGEPQPPQEAAAGIPAKNLDEAQKKILHGLLQSYIENVPDDVAKARLMAIDKAGFDTIHFAWAGATKPGIGHYYRLQGSSFLIEFVNTQPDPAGNPANHIHCVWRNPNGDFAIPIK